MFVYKDETKKIKKPQVIFLKIFWQRVGYYKIASKKSAYHFNLGIVYNISVLVKMADEPKNQKNLLLANQI